MLARKTTRQPFGKQPLRGFGESSMAGEHYPGSLTWEVEIGVRRYARNFESIERMSQRLRVAS
jgi:hypothetical protein